MAQRRMFSPKIVCSDAFLDMPVSSQALYFHLGMHADDDGFVNPRFVMRMAGVSEDDLKILLSKRFILPFENGVIVIKHWKINNLIKTDRYTPTIYAEQMMQLSVKENGSYTERNPSGTQMAPQVRLGKVRLGKVINTRDKDRFTPPTLEEVKKYCDERKNEVDAQRFIDFYSSKGWMIGRNKMRDWQAAVRTWEKGGRKGNSSIESIRV